jgi:hypothetical protein
MHVSHPLLLSLIYAGNIAPISAGRLVMLVSSRVSIACLSPSAYHSEIALIDQMQSLLCKLPSCINGCVHLDFASAIDSKRELSVQTKLHPSHVLLT